MGSAKPLQGSTNPIDSWLKLLTSTVVVGVRVRLAKHTGYNPIASALNAKTLTRLSI